MPRPRVVHVPGSRETDLPISRGMVVGNLVYVSGHGGFDPVTNAAPPSIEEQADLCFKDLQAVLEAAGTDLEHVAKVNVFLAKASDFAGMNQVFRRFFPTNPPARTTVVVGFVRPDMLIEAEMVAALP
jgi:2-iminobutanoate/2-iminopropanoate deaminase